MEHFLIKPIKIFGKTFNAVVLLAFAGGIGKKELTKSAVNYRLVLVDDKGAVASDDSHAGRLTYETNELPQPINGENLIGSLIEKINQESDVRIELA